MVVDQLTSTNRVEHRQRRGQVRATRKRASWMENAVLFFYAASVLLFSYNPELTYVTKVVGIGVGVIFLFRAMRGHIAWASLEWGLIGSWFLLAMVSAVLAEDQLLAMGMIVTLVQVLGLGFLIFALAVISGGVEAVWLGWVVALVGISVVTLLEPEAYSQYGRLTGTLGNANMYGYCLFAGTVFAAYFFLRSKSLSTKALWIIVQLLFLYTLFETGSRKAMVGVLLVGIVFLGYLTMRQFEKNFVRGVAVLVLGATLGAGAAYYVVKSTYFYRLENLITAVQTGETRGTDTSIRGRALLYKHAFRVAMSHPLLGVGPNNFQATSSSSFGGISKDVGTYSHSNYAEVLVSTGMFGFFLYFSVYVVVWIRLWRLRAVGRNPEHMALFLTAVLLALSIPIYDIGMVSYFEKTSWLVLATVIAAIHILARKKKEYSWHVKQSKL